MALLAWVLAVTHLTAPNSSARVFICVKFCFKLADQVLLQVGGVVGFFLLLLFCFVFNVSSAVLEGNNRRDEAGRDL